MTEAQASAVMWTNAIAGFGVGVLLLVSVVAAAAPWWARRSSAVRRHAAVGAA